MSDLTRRNAVRLVAGLATGASVLPGDEARGQEAKKEPHKLDAVFHVAVDRTQTIGFRFDLPGKADQSFSSDEYRYAVLDKDGVQVDKALAAIPFAIHTTHFPKDKRSVADYSDFMFDTKRLKSGEEYYLVVTVRNLTGLTKFKAV